MYVFDPFIVSQHYLPDLQWATGILDSDSDFVGREVDKSACDNNTHTAFPNLALLEACPLPYATQAELFVLFFFFSF
jgi:hypothetical protein